LIDHPKTLEDAKKYKYYQWAGNEKGWKYRDGDCAYEVYALNGWGSYQCSRKNGHGPGGLYCKQHGRMLK